MTYTEQAIKVAESAGLVIPIDFNSLPPGARAISQRALLLDPAFWRALGLGLGWTPQGGTGREYHDEYNEGGYPSMYDWQIKWHHFIDHLAEGQDPESYFKNLLEK